MPEEPGEREARLDAAEALRGLVRHLDTAAAAIAPMADRMESLGYKMPISVELRTPERQRGLYAEMLSVGDDLRRIAEEVEAC